MPALPREITGMRRRPLTCSVGTFLRPVHEAERNDMTNEELVRQAYAVAEVKDIPAWAACFTDDGEFVDKSVNLTYRGPDEVGKPVENYGTAFPDMHRELYDVYVSGDVVIVELALQGT